MNRFLIPVMSLLLLLPCSGNCAGLDGLVDLLAVALDAKASQQQEEVWAADLTALGASATDALYRQKRRAINIDTGQFVLVRVSSGVCTLQPQLRRP